MPPGLSTRHIPRTIASQWASSLAKWSTALLSTTSKLSASKDIPSTGSWRKFSVGKCGASARASDVTCATASGEVSTPQTSKPSRRK